jgi:hypothetical protein
MNDAVAWTGAIYHPPRGSPGAAVRDLRDGQQHAAFVPVRYCRPTATSRKQMRTRESRPRHGSGAAGGLPPGIPVRTLTACATHTSPIVLLFNLEQHPGTWTSRLWPDAHYSSRRFQAPDPTKRSRPAGSCGTACAVARCRQDRRRRPQQPAPSQCSCQFTACRWKQRFEGRLLKPAIRRTACRTAAYQSQLSSSPVTDHVAARHPAASLPVLTPAACADGDGHFSPGAFLPRDRLSGFITGAGATSAAH